MIVARPDSTRGAVSLAHMLRPGELRSRAGGRTKPDGNQGDFMSESESKAPVRLESYRLWECAQCDKHFLTEDIESTESCPYCGSEAAVAAEGEYDVVRA